MTRYFLITLTSLSLSITWATANAAPATYGPGIASILADNLEGDVDGNCIAGPEDLRLVQVSLGSDWVQGDVNGDTAVTIADAMTILAHMGDTCE